MKNLALKLVFLIVAGVAAYFAYYGFYIKSDQYLIVDNEAVNGQIPKTELICEYNKDIPVNSKLALDLKLNNNDILAIDWNKAEIKTADGIKSITVGKSDQKDNKSNLSGKFKLKLLFSPNLKILPGNKYVMSIPYSFNTKADTYVHDFSIKHEVITRQMGLEQGVLLLLGSFTPNTFIGFAVIALVALMTVLVTRSMKSSLLVGGALILFYQSSGSMIMFNYLAVAFVLLAILLIEKKWHLIVMPFIAMLLIFPYALTFAVKFLVGMETKNVAETKLLVIFGGMVIGVFIVGIVLAIYRLLQLKKIADAKKKILK